MKYSDIYKYKDGGKINNNKKLSNKENNKNASESTFVTKPNIINIPKDKQFDDNDDAELEHMYANELLKKYDVKVDSTSNILQNLGLNSGGYYNPITRTINYKHHPNKNPKEEYSKMVMSEIPHAMQSDSLGVIPFLKNTVTEGIQDLFNNDKLARYSDKSKIEGHAHKVLEEKLLQELYNPVLPFDSSKYKKTPVISYFQKGGIVKYLKDNYYNKLK